MLRLRTDQDHSAGMGRFASEAMVREMHDADLGRLELWVARHPAIGEGEVDFYEWRGWVGGLPLILGVDEGVEPDTQLGYLSAQTRATLRSLSARIDEVRHETAEREIALARDWANDGALSVETLADNLRASGIDVWVDEQSASIDIWFDDLSGIFAGHVLLAMLDSGGAVIDTSLEG